METCFKLENTFQRRSTEMAWGDLVEVCGVFWVDPLFFALLFHGCFSS